MNDRSILDTKDGRLAKFLSRRGPRCHIVAPAALIDTLTQLAPERRWTSSNQVAGVPSRARQVFVYDPRDEGRLLEQARRLHPDREVWGVMHDVMLVLITKRGWGAAETVDPPDPTVRFAVVCMPRTGSTFLCELLAAAGAGAAREHLRDPLLRVLGAEGVDHEHVYQRIMRCGAAGDVFGTKLIAHFLFDACTTRTPAEALLCMADRGFRFVHLTRDVMDQVISKYVSSQSRVWVSRGELTDAARDRLEQVEYKFDDLMQMVQSTLIEIDRLDEALATLDPACVLRLDYRDLVASPLDALQACGKHLGCPVHPERVDLAALPVRLSDAVDLHDALRRRFVDDRKSLGMPANLNGAPP